MQARMTAAGVLGGALLMLSASPAIGGSHLWRFDEIFTNLDGSVVFIEMVECCGAGNETNIAGRDITAMSGGTFVFPTGIPCTNCTANRKLLLATQLFADLPGAPTPDYIIGPALFDPAGDTLFYWQYGAATWNFGTVPTDGIRSLLADGTTAVNTPTNFDGLSGTITAPCRRSDVDISGDVDIGDLLGVLGAWGACVGCIEDLNDDLTVDVNDLLQLLAEWGSC